MAAPFVATSRLSNIVQMITLSGGTGILRVIRGQGATRELGQIRFVQGRPVAALLGHLTGDNALNVLSNWGECQYAFDEGSAAESMDAGMGMPNGAPQTGASGTSGGRSVWSSPPPSPTTSPSMNPSSASWPTYASQQSGPFAPQMPASSLPGELGEWSGAGGAQSYGQGSYPAGFPPGAQPRQTNYANYGPPMSGPASSSLPAYSPHPPSAAQSSAQPGAAAAPLPAEVSLLVPQRTAIAQQIDQLPLDRRERMVLLLVDGQRTLTDLARLTRRTEQEVYGVLAHLELLGLAHLIK